MLQNDPELFELSMSKKTQPLMDLVKKHCEENVKPIQAEYSACKMRRRIGGPGIQGKLSLWKAPKRKPKS